jgi:hypothetical protein
MKIRKAKIAFGAFLELEWDESTGMPKMVNKVSKKSKYAVHPDLIVAFDELKIHMARLADLIPSAAENEEINLKGINVHTIQIKGKGDNEGIILTGTKLTRHKKLVAVITPLLKWTDVHYEHIGELYNLTEEIFEECRQYLNGKHAHKEQLELIN